jgi:hypothetical protein
MSLVSTPTIIERLDHAIALTAYAMQLHNLPEILPTLKRLEAARADLLVNGDALEYAKRVLERITIEARKSTVANATVEGKRTVSLQNYNIGTNQPSACDAS